MGLEVHRVEYFLTTVKDQPGQAFNVLSQLAAAGVNLLAFVAIPLGPKSAQFTFFPEQRTLFTHRRARARSWRRAPFTPCSDLMRKRFDLTGRIDRTTLRNRN